MSSFLATRPIPGFRGNPLLLQNTSIQNLKIISPFFATANDIYQLLTMNTGGSINADLGPLVPVVEQSVK